MLGLRLFSIFSLLLASLFIQKSIDVFPLLIAEDAVRSTEKVPHIQVGEPTKITIKKKSYKTFFLASAAYFTGDCFSKVQENLSGFFVFYPKPSIENPSRAPPVV